MQFWHYGLSLLPTAMQCKLVIAVRLSPNYIRDPRTSCLAHFWKAMRNFFLLFSDFSRLPHHSWELNFLAALSTEINFKGFKLNISSIHYAFQCAKSKFIHCIFHWNMENWIPHNEGTLSMILFGRKNSKEIMETFLVEFGRWIHSR